MVGRHRGLLLESKLLARKKGQHSSVKLDRELIFQRNEWFIALAVRSDLPQAAVHHVDGDHRPAAIHGVAVGGQIPASAPMYPGEHWVDGFTGRRSRGNTEARNREQKNSYH
jgi:hypothetical protein